MIEFECEPIVVILVGGFGTRIHHLSSGVPKPLLEFDGVPFLLKLLQELKSVGFIRAHIQSAYRSDLFDDFIRLKCSELGVFLSHSFEITPMGTGGAVRLAWESLGRPSKIFLINGDSWIPSVFASMRRLDFVRSGAAVFAVEVQNCARYGVIEWDLNGLVRCFREKEGRNVSGWISSGACLLLADDICRLPQDKPSSLERDLLERLSLEKKLQAFPVIEPDFIDFGTPEDLERATIFFKQKT